jgi:chromosome segregation ATPase
LKTKHKGELLVTEERSKHLDNTKKDLDNDYLHFQSQWDLYLEKVNDNRNAISEMISILEEELKNKNMKQQLDRKKTVTLNRKWIEESKRNKTQTLVWLEENKKIQENLQILKSQEEQWLVTLKNNHNTLINELQTNLKTLEEQLKDKKNVIQNTKDLIENLENKNNSNSNIHEATIKHNRKILGELVQEKVLIDDAYNVALLDLNKFYKKTEEEIQSNPFLAEIKKYKTRIERNLLSSEKIKKREAIIINQNKLYLRDMRSHLEKLRENIEDNYLQLDKLNKTFLNQENRHQGEQLMYQKKFDKYYQSLNEENQYLDGLTSFQQKEIEELKDAHDSSVETIDFSLWDYQNQIDNIRLQSNTILQKIDQLNYKRNNLGHHEEITQKNIQKKKQDLQLELVKLNNLVVVWQNDLNTYQEKLKKLENDKQDFQVETLEKVQHFFKIRNNAEKELRLLQYELEVTQHDLKKSFDNRVNLMRIVNQEISKNIS